MVGLFVFGEKEMDVITRRLMRAYNRLQDKKHWTKGALIGWADGDDGENIKQHCLLGAMGLTDAGRNVRPYSCRYFVIEAIKELFPKRMPKYKPDGEHYGESESYTIANSPAYFNDHGKTKHQDVLAVLRRSIELSEAHVKGKKASEADNS